MRRVSIGLLLFCICLLFNSCGDKTSTRVDFHMTKVDYSGCVKRHWRELPDSLLGQKEYILLDTLNSDCDFGQMSKVLIKNNRIYILDSHLKKIVVYNAKGKGIGQVGRRGQGPDEYLDIADFDVTSDGSVYFIDGRLDKLFCFNDQLEFCKAYSLPFEADIISVLDEGFLFGLSSWNKGFGENNKIMRTDMELNVLNTCLEYDENTDPSFWISSYSFVCTPDFISYNQPIDNCIYLFDYKGNIQECIDFDFASENVPNEVKKNVEKYWDSFGDYCMLKNYTVVTKRVIAGSFLKNRKTVPFIFNRMENVCYSGDARENYDNSGTAGYSGSKWITYFEPDGDIREEIPDFVAAYLDNGGFALVLQSLY